MESILKAKTARVRTKKIEAEMTKTLRTLCIFLFICWGDFAGAQDTLQEPKRNFNYSIRGKFFFLPLAPEDATAIAWTIGNEFIFKRHSVGLDYSFFRSNHETDYETHDDPDLALYSDYESRSYLLVDYKFRLFAFERADIYLNSFCKYGLYKSWSEGVNEHLMDETYFLESTENGTFIEPGAGAGIKYYWGDFGCDISANYAYTIDKIDVVDVLSTTVIAYSSNKIVEKNRFYMRLNFFYIFR